MSFKVRRGTDSQRSTITFAEGELAYTTDTKIVYVGDGTTAGGIAVGPAAGTDNFGIIAVSGQNNVVADTGADTATFAGGTGITITTTDTTDTVTWTLATMVQDTIKGRITGSTGVPEDLTATQARNIVERGAAPTVAVTGDINPLAAATHAGKHLICDGAHTITITSATAFSVGQSCYVRNRAATAVNVTLVQGAGATVNVPSGQALTIPQFGVVEIYCAASNVYDVNGKTN